MKAELDLNKFRTLIPINSLYEDNLLQLLRHVHTERYVHGEYLFRVGDIDEDSVFLMSGEVARVDEDGRETIIASGSDVADYALANRRPRRFSARVASDVAVVARVDRSLLEKHLTWGQMASENQESFLVDEFDSEALKDSEWMMSILQTQAFLRLPAANIQKLFETMEEIVTNKGDVIVRQGDPGDFYYFIKEGTCQVSRRTGRIETVLAELKRNDCFGEEALISDAPRNASVSMLSDGVLMRLSKAAFVEMLEEPLLSYVNLREASNMVENGAVRIDVRLEREHNLNGIKGSLNIPLYLLRLKCRQLDQKRRYILYCDTGARSSAAAFIMRSEGFDAYVLKDGLAGAGVGAPPGSRLA